MHSDRFFVPTIVTAALLSALPTTGIVAQDSPSMHKVVLDTDLARRPADEIKSVPATQHAWGLERAEMRGLKLDDIL